MLVGGPGNDTYVLENGADGVSNSGGVDSATSTISRSLAVGSLTAVENLTLANFATALNGVGNNLNNVITGNNFNNTLAGGNGNDTLKWRPRRRHPRRRGRKRHADRRRPARPRRPRLTSPGVAAISGTVRR